MASIEPSVPGNLVVRPVVEEFKAYSQERIAQLERSKKVEALRVYLDAAELGVQILLETLMESAGEDSLPDNGCAGPDRSAGRPESDEEPGVETEYLDAQEEPDTRARPAQWNMPRADEVLAGEEGAQPGPRDEDPHAGENAPGTGQAKQPDAKTGKEGEGEGKGEEGKEKDNR